MVSRRLLHWKARRILRKTPTSWRGSDAEVQESLSAGTGSARGQRQARSVGGAVHRAGGDAVRGGVVLGHGRLRTVEGGIVAALPSPGAWHPESRYIQPGVSSAQAAGLRVGIPSLHGGLCQGQWPQADRGV